MLIRTASIVLSLSGVLSLILGLLIWAGMALNLLSMHMLLGFLSVGALWLIGVGQAFAEGGSWIIAAAALFIGALTLLFGLYQASLLVGDFHWVIQLTHLFLGVLTIGMGHMGAARSRKAAAE
ncbi:MAG: hypothetical protein ACREQO_15810 [Candidatus Binatia bacterium]